MDSFGREALEAHNRYRADHGAGPLTWSSSMAREAESWARRLASEGRLKHADSKDGENIYMCFGMGDVGGAVAVDSWYGEIKDYNFSRPGFQGNTGHFTQVVWNGSRELGIGKAKSRDGKLFVVGRYRPAGNNLRNFPDNVFPRGGGPPKGGTTASREYNGPRRQEPTRLNNYNDRSRGFQPISSQGNKGSSRVGNDDEFDRYRRMFEAENPRSQPDAKTKVGGTYQVKETIRTETGPDGRQRRAYVREAEKRYEASFQEGGASKRGDVDEFDRYRKMFDETSHKDTRSSPRFGANRPGQQSRNLQQREDNKNKQYGDKQDTGTKKYVTRTQRDDGGYEEKTETVTQSADGSKRTVVSTITVSVNKGDSDSIDSKPFSGFSRDMRRDLPKDDRRYAPSSEKRSPHTSSAVKNSGSSQKEFANQALIAHNRYRAAHGVPPLKWSEQIAREAQAWAEKLANERSLRHSSKTERKGCGENLAMFTGKFDEAGNEATNMWYEEVKDYKFRRAGFQSNTGHFTQVVWKESKELGMGRASTRDGRLTFVVGRYNPAGNVVGYFDNNVYPKSR